MWHDISRDLKRIDQDELTPPNQKDAYHYINHQLRLAKKNQTPYQVSSGIKR